jgi:hypothetical protein
MVEAGRENDPRPARHHAAAPSIGTNRLFSSYCRPQTIAAMPRNAACGLAPLASHRAMNRGGTSTTKTFEAGTLDGWNFFCDLDMTALRFARRPAWAPLAIQSRIARRRVKVCAAIHLDLDAPSTVRGWGGNGEHPLIKPETAAFVGRAQARHCNERHSARSRMRISELRRFSQLAIPFRRA